MGRLGTISRKDLRDRTALLAAVMDHCVLCPRECGADRRHGETGFCLLGSEAVIGRILPHFGEEPPISGQSGAGTVFFSSCNLRCSFCQNYQISHNVSGEVMDGSMLCRRMLALKEMRCHNIEAVTPTPQIVPLLEALAPAREQGLDLPLVYNCGGYENPEVLRLLEGIADVYLPDFKYGDERDAAVLSGVRDYPQRALAALDEMVRQAGAELRMEGDIAVKGVIVRHLVLPGRLRNSLQALRLIAKHVSTTVPVSIMSQYTPIPAVANDPLLGQRTTKEEYEAVVDYALDLGLETIFSQGC